ncbi:MAG: lamin tail domain-containing protein [FCB group bacterium]|nr:lamin tail domain-containing protein [FCB group bacterium]
MIDAIDENTGEFIEIYNVSDLAIDLTRFYLCDPQDTDAILPFPDFLIGPGCYGIILDPDYAGEYDHLIPDSVPRFTIEDSRFGMYGISNSTSKAFSLLNENKQVVDTYTTGLPCWAKEAFTMERYRPESNEWKPSLVLYGTPGTRNSVSPKEHDLRLRECRTTPESDRILAEVLLDNYGLADVAAFTIGYIMDIFDTRPDLRVSDSFPVDTLITSGDSCWVSLSLPLIAKGALPLTIYLCTEPGVSDTLSCLCRVPVSADELIITEFVCKTGSNFSCEYIELLSRSSLPVQCKDLFFADLTGSVVFGRDYILYPDSLLVIAQSESFHDDFPFVKNVIYPPAWRSLNNDQDAICIRNRDETIICDLFYDNSWSIPNNSAMLLVDSGLDYRKSENWEISYAGSPGSMNQTQKQLFHYTCLESGAFITPRDTLRFRFVNDGYYPIPPLSINLTTPRVNTILSLPGSTPGDTVTCIPDTYDLFIPGTQYCRIAANDSNMVNAGFKYYFSYTTAPCFFNEILSDPLDTYGQAEFIELECRVDALDLENWKIHVNNGRLNLSGNLSRGFSVLCKSGDIVHNVSADRRLIFSAFPNLPNAGAYFKLEDPAGNILDECDLRDHPRMERGRSLEKQFENITSFDPSIWYASVAEEGMTPAQRNSITILPGCRDALSVYPQIFSHDEHERIQINIDSQNGLLYCELFCFNAAGREIWRDERSMFSQPAVSVFWDGRTKTGDRPARGIYLLLAVLHDIEGNTRKLHDTLIIR